jgi:hypothetical protein
MRTLARLCYRQETRLPQAFKRKRVGLVICKANSLSFLNKRKKSTANVKRSPRNLDYNIVIEEVNLLQRENFLEVQS